MKLAAASSMARPLGIGRIEMFMPEPIEAWIPADFVGSELGASEDDDAE